MYFVRALILYSFYRVALNCLTIVNTFRQKNNIFECKAEVPTIPYVEPIRTWKGMEVTTEIARGLMIGHLEGVNESLEVSRCAIHISAGECNSDKDKYVQACLKLDVSWKVACGANVAYDQFPSQNQVGVSFAAIVRYSFVYLHYLIPLFFFLRSYSIQTVKERISGTTPFFE